MKLTLSDLVCNRRVLAFLSAKLKDKTNNE